mmetsp:Transcript_4466/g.11359  ORF Transcript_4466/g.11359 Transcript_4466/m.11359 type:complete len:622 (+) Transcript_4466:43-1908(+)
MFYHEYVLAKRGTLGNVWLAAHWEKKLSRSAIAKHDVVNSCMSIIKPVTPLALRTSGHLLLGVVRIHDGKAKDLMTDCSNALCQIKRAYTPGMDTASVKTTASHAAITLRDGDVGDGDELPEYIETGDAGYTGHANVGRADEISMPAENDFMEADYAAPDMAEAFEEGEFPADEVPFYDEQHGEEYDAGIEQGRNALDQADISAVSHLDDTALEQHGDDYEPGIEQGRNALDQADISAVSHLDDTAHDPTLDLPDDDFPAPELADNIPLDASADRTANMFDDDVDPDFGRETPVVASSSRRVEEERVEDITLGSLEPSVASTSAIGSAAAKASSSFSLGRKRKLIIDSISISRDAMQSALTSHGPDDITRQPYSEEIRPLAFGRPAPTREALRRRLHDTSIDARYARPMTMNGQWKGKALKAWQRGFQTRINLPAAPDVDPEDIEMGRRNPVDESAFLPEMDEEPLENDDMPPPQNDDFEPFPFGDEAMPGPIDESTEHEVPGVSASLGGTTLGSDSAGEDPSLHDSRVNEERDVEVLTAEERDAGLTRRTVKMMSSLRAGFEVQPELSYVSLTRGKDRHTAAACLFELLALKTKDFIEIEQDAPFGDIRITPMEQVLQSA